MNAKTFISATGDSLVRAEVGTDGTWVVQTVLNDTQVNCLVSHPAKKDVVYAGTQDKGLLRSDDAGRSWHSAGLDDLIVKSISICRSQPLEMYLGTKPPAVYVSHNGGVDWQECESFRALRRGFWNTPAEAGDPFVQGLAVSPTDPNIVIAGVEYGATFRSADGGKTWQGHLKGTSRDCHSLTFHATDGNWVYQGGGGWPAAVSSDSGVTWKQPRRGMGWSLYGWSVAADPEHPDIWYVCSAPLLAFPKVHLFPRMHWDGHANSYIFRKKGDGRWERLSGGLPQPLNFAAYALLTDPEASGHLYAGLSSGDVWHTTDFGDSWQKLPFNLTAIHRSLVIF